MCSDYDDWIDYDEKDGRSNDWYGYWNDDYFGGMDLNCHLMSLTWPYDQEFLPRFGYVFQIVLCFGTLLICLSSSYTSDNSKQYNKQKQWTGWQRLEVRLPIL